MRARRSLGSMRPRKRHPRIIDGPIGVVGFNTFEGWSQDVSHDVAQELRRRCDLHGRDVPSDIHDFVDRHDAVDRSQLSLPMRPV
jgi:hypothetical protein